MRAHPVIGRVGHAMDAGNLEEAAWLVVRQRLQRAERLQEQVALPAQGPVVEQVTDLAPGVRLCAQ